MKVDNVTPSLKIQARVIGTIRASHDANLPEIHSTWGLPDNRSPCLARLDLQLECMTVAANVVFQLVDRELLLDDQIPDEIAD